MRTGGIEIKQQVEKTCNIFSNLLFYKMARPEGVEPPTAWFVARPHVFTCSINQSLAVLAHQYRI